MTKIPLSSKKLSKLKREAAGSPHAFRQLCRESVARKWLKNRGIPSLGNPEAPPSRFSSVTVRYGIMLEDGSRFIVCRASDAVVSFDAVAAAKCFCVMGISLDEDCASGEPKGYVLLSDIEPGLQRYDFTEAGHGTPASFLKLAGPGGRYLTRLLKMSIRLLILGEPEVPSWGVANVRAFEMDSGRRWEV